MTKHIGEMSKIDEVNDNDKPFYLSANLAGKVTTLATERYRR